MFFMFRKLLDFILNLFYPSKCIYCKEIINFNEKVCPECNLIINSIPPRLTKLYLNNYTDIICLSALCYEGNFKRAIVKFKFRGHTDYSEHFADVMAKMLNDNLDLTDFDYITCVPISKQRQKKRGYNQSELIATDISQKVNLPYKNTLIKIKDNLPQHTLSREKRKTN